MLAFFHQSEIFLNFFHESVDSAMLRHYKEHATEKTKGKQGAFPQAGFFKVLRGSAGTNVLAAIDVPVVEAVSRFARRLKKDRKLRRKVKEIEDHLSDVTPMIQAQVERAGVTHSAQRRPSQGENRPGLACQHRDAVGVDRAALEHGQPRVSGLAAEAACKKRKENKR